MDWRASAACRGLDPDLFFTERNDGVTEAKAVCWGCPVRRECLAYAMAQEDSLSGIWGATTRKQRRLHRSKSA